MDKQIRWLYEELPKWVAEGIISEDTADRLRVKYGEVRPQGAGWAGIIWVSLAAILIGFGVVLLLAESWYDIGRDTRFWMILGMLIVSQVLALAVVYLAPHKTAWREAAGVFHGLVFSGGMALASTLFALDTTQEWKLVLTTAILLLPMVYVIKSSLLASLYVILAAAFAGADGAVNAWFGKDLAWLLVLAGAPYFYLLHREGGREKAMLLYGWCYGAAVYWLYFWTGWYDSATAPLLFALLAVLTLLLGGTIGGGRLWGAPFRIIGAVAVIGSILNSTWVSVWERLGNEAVSVLILPTVVGVLLLFVLGGIMWRLARARRWEWVALCCYPFLVAVLTVLAVLQTGYLGAALLMMVYYVLATVWLLIKGLRSNSLLYTDTALAMTAAFIALRLLDDRFSYWQRGVAFLVLGLVVLAVHIWLSRRRLGRDKKAARKVQAAKRRLTPQAEPEADEAKAAAAKAAPVHRPAQAEAPAKAAEQKPSGFTARPFVPSEGAVPKVVVPPAPRFHTDVPEPQAEEQAAKRTPAAESVQAKRRGEERGPSAPGKLRWQAPARREHPHFGVEEEKDHD